MGSGSMSRVQIATTGMSIIIIILLMNQIVTLSGLNSQLNVRASIAPLTRRSCDQLPFKPDSFS